MVKPIEAVTFRSKFGSLRLAVSGKSLVSAAFIRRSEGSSKIKNALLKKCLKELREYFEGRRPAFTLKLDPRGTRFEKRVWQALRQIPAGRMVSYKEVASWIGRKKAVRAVAGAIGRNPLPILIPCHRVIGSDGRLMGYAYGLSKKARLLKHERRWASIGP